MDKRNVARWVYVIGPADGSRPVKVGVAHNMATRMSSMQCNSPVRLMIHASWRIRHDVWAKDVEWDVHQALAAHRLHGEWFDVSPAQAVSVASAWCADHLCDGTLSPDAAALVARAHPLSTM